MPAVGGLHAEGGFPSENACFDPFSVSYHQQ